MLQERQKILLRFADLVEKHNDEIAALETWDNGKPYEQSAQIEVPMFARLFRYYAGGYSEGWENRNKRFLLFWSSASVMIFHLFTLQAGQIRFTVSQFQQMDPIMFKLCTNQLVWLARLFHGTSLSWCLLGKLDLHWPVATPLFSKQQSRHHYLHYLCPSYCMRYAGLSCTMD